jgi:hypothetical protein
MTILTARDLLRLIFAQHSHIDLRRIQASDPLGNADLFGSA